MRWGGEGNGEKSAFDVEISFSKCPILCSGLKKTQSDPSNERPVFVSPSLIVSTPYLL
jgi:hypothetical protein